MARIMLAEDDVTMVGLLKTLLKMDGFDVVTLDADADVPAAVKRDSPDVLLMDVHFAKQDGIKILDSIRKVDGIRNQRVIMISGMNLEEQCLGHGADGFLLKPFMPDELMKMLATFKKQ